MGFVIEVVKNLMIKLPYSNTCVLSYPVGIMTYKLVLLMICGEAIITLIKKKESL